MDRNMSDDQNFETSLQELEQIVEHLEQGGLKLEDSLKLFEQGTKIFAKCNKMLDTAQTRMEVLFEQAGQWKTEPLSNYNSQLKYEELSLLNDDEMVDE